MTTSTKIITRSLRNVTRNTTKRNAPKISNGTETQNYQVTQKITITITTQQVMTKVQGSTIMVFINTKVRKRKTNPTICLTRLTQTQFTQRNQQLQIQLKQQRRQLDVQHRTELWKLMQSEAHLYNHRQHDFILVRQEKEHALLIPD